MTPTCSKQKKWPKVVFDALGDFVVVYFQGIQSDDFKMQRKEEILGGGDVNAYVMVN